ncbi:uncharacterized protein K452DRAFT_218703 [Aplosporella prunicola CBS 121167]|uniref:Major facilitator superfamily (MFS) profile domain-containing protein n=1 Tax=Aplosporella prunicola CBS 121167 TaxID=1176127 RepID=A0A6A6BUS0_9PEZI|nr:uncharacterized protein K452DRAFT_218703 [Aplosporella prunicola CBS 121167]KAF2146964.1 hypothetical protein K452DRAFT_218703 [Aplosporella prunicola CBS 121167]
MGQSSQAQNAAQLKHDGVLRHLHRFYRGTLYQAIMLGLVSFTQPGIWTALNNLGAGGLASPFFVNAANVVTFAIMVFCAPLSAVLGNRFNLKWVLVFGTLGYAPYSAALYCNSVFGTQWFLIFGAATCGFSAAALWTSEAALAVGYPELERRGFYISIWLALNKIGSLISTSIQLALNMDRNQKGSISPKTFLVLVALQCVGLPMALTVAPPDKLIRSDGTKPIFAANKLSIKQNFKDLWATFKLRNIYLLIPIFISAQWGQTYQGNYLAAYFSVRGRTLAGFIVAVLSLIVDFGFGWLLDSDYAGLTRRRSLTARYSWLLITVFYTATWIWNFVLQADLAKTSPQLDIDSPGFGRAVGVYIFYRIGYEIASVWQYWVLGTFDSDIATLAYTTSILRAGESLGSTFSYGVGASKSASLMTNLIVAAVVFWVSVPTTFWAAWRVTDAEVEMPGRNTSNSTSAEDVERIEPAVDVKS